MPHFSVNLCTSIGVALSTSLLSLPALAQDAPASKPHQTLDEVVVTGSRIPSETAVWQTRPLTVIDADEISRLGGQEIARTLRQEPAFNGGTYNGGNGGYFSGGTNDLNLRGIGSQYTLVLVNGRPFTSSVSNIPASAISRIEILKDGGSSVYGSASVAGVVNFIMDTDSFDGLEVSGTHGQRVGRGGADAYDTMAGLKFGTQGERSRFGTSFEYRKRGGTKLTDSELGRTANMHLINRYSSPANIRLPDNQNVILDYTRFNYGDYSIDPADYIPYVATDYNNGIGMAERDLLNDRSPQEAVSNFSFWQFDIRENVTAFMELFYSHTNQSEKNKNWGVNFFGDSSLDFGPVPASNPYNPFGVDLRGVYYGLPELGGVDYDTSLATYRVVGGVKGEVGRFGYEVGITYMRDEYGYTMSNQYSNSGLLEAINRPGPDALNPFCWGCNTPEQLEGIRVSDAIGWVSQTQRFDAQLTGNLIQRDSYKLDFALGAEARKDLYEYKVDPLTQTGDIYHQTFYPYSVSSDGSSAFAELVYSINEGAGIPGIHKLTAQASVRGEWIDQGSDVNPHVSVSWHPVGEAFMVRGSYGTSYVPAPLYLIADTQYVSNYTLAYPNGEFLPTDVVEGGNPDLKPEEATGVNMGFVYAPTQLPGSTLSVDFWRIHQKGVVLVPNPQDIIDGLYPGTVDYSGVRPRIEAFATNAGDRKVEGLDIALDLRFATDTAGTFGFRAHGTLMTRFDVDNGPGPDNRLGEFSNFVFVSTSYGNFGSIPRLRALGGPNWKSESGDLSTQLTVNYTAGYADGPGTDRDVGAFVTLDANLDYDLSRFVPRLQMSAGLLNMTDEEPPFVEAYRNLFVIYDTGLSNSLGRLGFVSLKYRF